MIKRIRQAALLEAMTSPRIWSVKFDPDSDSPVGTRAGLARGMVAEVAVGSEQVRNDFDEISIFQRPLFNATWDDKNGRWVDLVERGEEGFTLSPTEAGREVVYRSTPFWYQLEISDTGRICRVSVSDEEINGYTLAPMFRDGSKPVYRPAFEAAIDDTDGLLHSRAGLTPTEAAPHDWYSLMESRANRARSENGAEWFSDYLLLLVEFATFNLQSVMQGVCGERVSLFNAHDMDEMCPIGLYTEYTNVYTKGDEIILLADDGTGYGHYGKYTVTAVFPYEDVGDLIMLGGLDLETFFLQSDEWAAIPARAKTGVAISAVTNASSGRASAHPMSPIVWRGKENPWGNMATILWDYTLKINKLGYAQLLHLNPDSISNLFRESDYLPCGEEYPFFMAEDSFVMGMAKSPEGDFLYPVLFENTAIERYFATRSSQYRSSVNKDTFCVIAVGSDTSKSVGTNFATTEFVSATAPDSRWKHLGSRLAVKEK